MTILAEFLSILVNFTMTSLIVLKSRDHSYQFLKSLNPTWFHIQFQEKLPNFKELARKF